MQCVVCIVFSVKCTVLAVYSEMLSVNVEC